MKEKIVKIVIVQNLKEDNLDFLIKTLQIQEEV